MSAAALAIKRTRSRPRGDHTATIAEPLTWEAFGHVGYEEREKADLPAGYALVWGVGPRWHLRVWYGNVRYDLECASRVEARAHAEQAATEMRAHALAAAKPRKRARR